jgi:HTH-type transcriptional regulator / antitoxin HigA
MRNTTKTSGKSGLGFTTSKAASKGSSLGSFNKGVILSLNVPTTPEEYEALASLLDQVLRLTKYEEEHPLNIIVDALSELIAAYDAEHGGVPQASPPEVLKFLMEQHDLKQSDMKEIGSQGVVSEVLSGRRQLNSRQIKALAKRFNVSPSVFFQEA